MGLGRQNVAFVSALPRSLFKEADRAGNDEDQEAHEITW